MPTQADVDYWRQHQTDMPKQHRNVRYRDVVDLAARNADVHELPVIQAEQIGALACRLRVCAILETHPNIS